MAVSEELQRAESQSPSTSEDPLVSLYLDRATHGDSEALDSVIRKYRGRAYRLALSLTHDPDEAGDVVAESMMRMERSITRFNRESSFWTWFSRILTNCFYNLKRYQGVRKPLSYPMNEALAQDESERAASDFEFVLDEQELARQRRQLWTALDRLSSSDRKIYSLFYERDHTLRQIADELEVPTGTVKSRLHRLRSKLCELLASN